VIRNPNMTEHEWAQYIQQYKPETEADAIEFLQTLFEYSNIANMEAQVAEFKAEGVGRKFPSTKELHTYKGIMRNANKFQHHIQDGFINGNSNTI